MTAFGTAGGEGDDSEAEKVIPWPVPKMSVRFSKSRSGGVQISPERELGSKFVGQFPSARIGLVRGAKAGTPKVNHGSLTDLLH